MNGKKGVSLMIGYVLLISLAVVMGVALFAWMKSYVPKEKLECPDGTSVQIKNYTYNCSDTSTIELTIRNNGKFSVAGFFIKADNGTNSSIASIELSDNFINTIGVDVPSLNNAVLLGEIEKNELAPGDEKGSCCGFNLSDFVGNVTIIEIIPVRWQVEENKLNFVSCGEDSRYREIVTCNVN